MKEERLFNLKISETLRQAIRRDAFEQDKSASAVVRDLLEKHYNIKKDEKERT